MPRSFLQTPIVPRALMFAVQSPVEHAAYPTEVAYIDPGEPINAAFGISLATISMYCSWTLLFNIRLQRGGEEKAECAGTWTMSAASCGGTWITAPKIRVQSLSPRPSKTRALREAGEFR